MNLREVNWRFVLYFGGLVGGITWAVMASVVLDALNSVRATDFRVPLNVWLVIGGTSLAILAVGGTVAAIGRSITVRSAGIGLAVSALAGWVMIAWIAVQFLFGE
jgi:hypothetical protein